MHVNLGLTQQVLFTLTIRDAFSKLLQVAQKVQYQPYSLATKLVAVITPY